MSETGSNRLRLLCLHGYHGSGNVLRTQMGALADAFALEAELVFIDAPSRIGGDFGWWHAVDAEHDPANEDPGVDGLHKHYKGWARTRDMIVRVFEEQGPFDGVFGFSQGAALTGLLVGMRAPSGGPTSERPLQFDFAILVSGFSSRDPDLARFYERTDGYALPSLHIMGRSDGIVAIETSRVLARRFESPTIIEHGGGHVVPQDRSVIDGAFAFLRARPRRILGPR